MILDKVVWDGNRGIECHYKCSICGKAFDGSQWLPIYCPMCGRLLDKEGKPGMLRETAKIAVALVFVAIKNGLLKDPLPKVEERGKDWMHEYFCKGEPADPKPET